ncbi:MAG: right-handed parallel beta-helix repeat-containing protein [Acidobacteriota bacterium]
MSSRILRASSATFIIAFLLLGPQLGVVASMNAETAGNSYYVSPTGRSTGDGSIGNPWDLQTGITTSVVRPGDTVWMRGGIYRGTYLSKLNGTGAAPIKVRQYPGERATIDGGNSRFGAILSVWGSFTWYWGFEIMSSDPIRVSGVSGSNPGDISRGGAIALGQADTTGAGLKFINLVIHDAAGGFALWEQALDAEVNGCLIYYNGWTGPDRGHGHGIYVQNLTSTKRIVDNLIFSNFSHGVQAYGTSAAFLNNITMQGNTMFDNGLPVGFPARNILIGGDSIAQSPKISDNVLYYPTNSGQNLNVGYDPYGAGANNPIVTNNYVVNGDTHFSAKNTNVTMSGNSFYSYVDPTVQTRFPTNLYAGSHPTSTQIFVRPSLYEAGRANVTILNWNLAPSVNVDLSSVLAPGASYEIRNAQNFFGGPVRSGVYTGGGIAVPMTGSPAGMVGYSTPPAPAELHAFVVLTVSGGPAPTATPLPRTSTPTPRPPTPTPTRTQTPTPRPGVPTATRTPTPRPGVPTATRTPVRTSTPVSPARTATPTPRPPTPTPTGAIPRTAVPSSPRTPTPTPPRPTSTPVATGRTAVPTPLPTLIPRANAGHVRPTTRLLHQRTPR